MSCHFHCPQSSFFLMKNDCKSTFLLPHIKFKLIEALVRKNVCTQYRVSPTYAVFFTADPTTLFFGLCTHTWGIFTLVGDLYSPTNVNFV